MKYVKEKIANYKRNIDNLDDCIFVSVIDELSDYDVSLKKFDELLNKENLSKSEEMYVCYLIEFTNSLIREKVERKILELIEYLDVINESLLS